MNHHMVAAVPSQTRVLFVLLILALVAATILDPLNPTTEMTIGQLVSQAIDPTALPEVQWSPAASSVKTLWWLGAAGVTLRVLLFPLVALLACAVLLLKPLLLRWRLGLERMDERYPDLALRFGGLAQEMGIARPPRLLWSPTLSLGAFVFSGFQLSQVVITEGIVDQFQQQPDALSAVMAHELGHVANGDVWRTEAAEALVGAYTWVWLGIALVQVIGWVVAVAILGEQDVAWDWTFFASFIYVAVLFVLMNALSRVQELHADRRVVELDRGAALRDALLSVSMPSYFTRLESSMAARRIGFSASAVLASGLPFVRQSWELVWNPQPGLRERLTAIQEVAAILRPRLAVSFATGFIAYRLGAGLPAPQYIQVAATLVGILAVTDLILVPWAPHLRMEKTTVARGVLVQLVTMAAGIGVAGMLVQFSQRVANSMALLSASYVARWQEFSGVEPVTAWLLLQDAWEQAAVALWCLVALVGAAILGTVTLGLWTRYSPLSQRLEYQRLRRWFGGLAWLTGGACSIAMIYTLLAVTIVWGAWCQGIAIAQCQCMEQQATPESMQAALSWAEQAVAINPRSPTNWIQLGYFQAGLYQRETAIKSFSGAIDLNSKFIAAYYDRGITYEQGLNRSSEAIEDYNLVINLNPNFPGVYRSRGHAYFMMEEYWRSIDDYDIDLCRTSRDREDLAVTYYYRAYSYYVVDQSHKALNDINIAIELNPKYGRAYEMRGLLSRRQGSSKNAKADSDEGRRIIRQEPENSTGGFIESLINLLRATMPGSAGCQVGHAP